MGTVRISHQTTRSASFAPLGLSGPTAVLLMLLALLIVALVVGSDGQLHGTVHPFAHPVAR